MDGTAIITSTKTGSPFKENIAGSSFDDNDYFFDTTELREGTFNVTNVPNPTEQKELN